MAKSYPFNLEKGKIKSKKHRTTTQAPLSHSIAYYVVQYLYIEIDHYFLLKNYISLEDNTNLKSSKSLNWSQALT